MCYNMLMENDYTEWMAVKNELNKNAERTKFSEGQIWWAGIGKNVGVEINGKNEDFSRPVVIFKKLSHLSFLAIPLTSQHHEGSWYVDFVFRGKHEYANLAQIRLLGVERLYNRMGKLSASDYKKIKNGFLKLIK